MKLMAGVHIMVTGGTIDSFYDGTKDTAVPLEHSAIPGYLALLRLRGALITEICMKDSRQITRRDLNKLVRAVEQSPRKRFLVTHGTYTMPDTARFLKANLKRKDATVVLTGSMIPLQGFAPSDAPFNLGFTLAQLEHLGPGVHVCMSGQVFAPEEVAKNMKKGEFYSIHGDESGVR